MQRELSGFDGALEERGADGYLVHASADDADQYYLSGFDAPDPFVTLYDGEIRLFFVRSLEFGRAKREADAATVERASDYGFREIAEEHGTYEATARTTAAFLDAHDVETVLTPPRFPLVVADGLRACDVSVAADEKGLLEDVRATKTDQEIEHVRQAQAANEAAMARAEELLAAATVGDDGTLRHGAEVLTSERVKEEIEVTLLRHGCALDDTIVACGADAAEPHERGSGPLVAGESIIVDIFPRHKTTRYHGDMTRTFSVGEPSDTVREWHELTHEAFRAAMETVEAGVTGADVHAAACDVYEEAGLPTLRTDEGAETGFIHSTGHGVGLEVHEAPQVSPSGGELEPGHVITIEPGLYDPDVGGVRIEDLVVVTADGYENLTDHPIELTI